MLFHKRLPKQWRYRTRKPKIEPRTIAVWRPGGYGDTIMTIPLMRWLKAAYWHTSVTFYGHHAAGRIMVEEKLAICAVPAGYGTDGPWLLTDQAGFMQGDALDRLRAVCEGVDLAIVFSRNPDLAEQGLILAGVPAYVVGCVLPPAPMHQVRYMNQVAQELGYRRVYDAVPRFCDLPHIETERQVLIHAGSSNEGSNKRWPAERYAELSHCIAGAGYLPVLLIGPDDSDIPGFIGDRMTGCSIHMVQHAMISSRLYIGNDSGMTHLAAAIGTPTLALFGPTHPETWAPLGKNVHVLRACERPASSPVSNFEAEVCSSPRCMDGLAVHTVASTALSLLKGPYARYF